MQERGGARRHLHLQAAEDAGCGEKVHPDRSVREKNNDWGKFREGKEEGGQRPPATHLHHYVASDALEDRQIEVGEHVAAAIDQQ